MDLSFGSLSRTSEVMLPNRSRRRRLSNFVAPLVRSFKVIQGHTGSVRGCRLIPSRRAEVCEELKGGQKEATSFALFRFTTLSVILRHPRAPAARSSSSSSSSSSNGSSSCQPAGLIPKINRRCKAVQAGRAEGRPEQIAVGLAGVQT